MDKNENKIKKSSVADIAYIGASAALIVVCSWITIPLPSVPITLQNLAICLVAGLLGAKKGTISLIIYILLGMVGLPVFSGFKSGIAAITGPTGGYIIGFIFTMLIAGIASDKFNKRFFLKLIFMVVGVLVGYAFGTVWFMVVYKVGFASALATCVLPFLLPDAVKIVIAAVLSSKLKKILNKNKNDIAL